MTVIRTARRRRKQMVSNNAHLSGLGVPRYRTPLKDRKVSFGSGGKRKSK